MPLALIVGPFPSCISLEQKESFMKHFGAITILHIQRKKNIMPCYMQCFFSSELECEYTLKQVHQRKILGKRLIAKYCDANIEAHENQEKGLTDKQESAIQNVKYIEQLRRYEALLSSVSSTLGINFPVSPKLRYFYPPPTAITLVNIVNSLVAVPKFYTQVLHLMNKMNLPCPFESEMTESLTEEAKAALKMLGIIRDETATEKQIVTAVESLEKEVDDGDRSITDSESELESDGEPRVTQPKSENIRKRTVQRKNPIRKKPKLELLKVTLSGTKMKRAETDRIKITDIFEKPEMSSLKKMEFNLSSDLPVQDETSCQETQNISEGFGKLYPPGAADSVKQQVPSERPQFIPSEELQSNRVSQTDWALVPVFKNYAGGCPSCRLYIKNLAKTITEADLKFIFGKYVTWDDPADADKFAIRLMKEGRMKGQAFITFSSTESATKALGEVNGFIWKDKPMVIMYGKMK